MSESIDFELNGQKLSVSLDSCPELKKILCNEDLPPAKEWTIQDEKKYRESHPEEFGPPVSGKIHFDDSVDWHDDHER